jgi:cytochrome c biogenesis protein CcmG/thiol:disulfide interchange protein DsbE
MFPMTSPDPAHPSRPWVRLAWVLIPALSFLALIVAATLKAPGQLAPGDPAPTFEGELLDGSGTIASGSLTGKPYVLNFWASWCVPCKAEAPLLKAAADKYADEVKFIGVDVRDARSDAVRFAAEEGLDYPHLRDEDREIYEDFGLTGQPETFFVDAQGVIVEHVAGELNEQTLTALLEGLARTDG